MIDGEPPHERERVLIGAHVAAGAPDRDLVFGNGAAFPHDPQLGALPLALVDELDLGDHRADQQLAVAVAGRRRVERGA